MSKKNDGKAGMKLPKQIAGVKLPKELRKKGDALIAQASSPEGRAAIAKGVTVVAGAAAAMAQAAAAKKQPATEATAKPEGATIDSGDALANAIGAGVDAVLGRLFPKA